jgi:diamine N-acetyltransferase
MVTLKTDHCYLRALEPEDLEFVYKVENDESVWEVSNTNAPYSRFLIKEYLENAHKDIYEVKQLRMVICNNADKAIGLIDLFDFDIKNKRAGIGILIKDKDNRFKGFGKSALKMMVNYSFNHLNLHQLFCNISEDNKPSIVLFEQQGFTKIGVKKDWNFTNGKYTDEYLYQILNNVH